MKKNIIFYTVLFITMICLTIIFVPITFQNDTFYSIKIGEFILKNGIDMKDHFSIISGLSYTYPHWLFDLVVFIFYNFLNFKGVYFFTLIFSFILLFSLYKTTNNVIKDRGIAYFTMALLGLSLIGFYTARAQIVSYTLLLIILYSIEKIRETNLNKYLIYIFVSSIILVNVHLAVYPIVFFLFLPYFVQDLVYIIRKKRTLKIEKNKKVIKLNDSLIEIEDNKNYKKLLIAFIITVVSGFIVPDTFGAYTYIIKSEMGVSMGYIMEHAPATIKTAPFLFIFLGIIIFIILLGNIKVKLKDLFFIGGFAVLSLLSIRSYALFAVLCSFSLARIFKVFVNKRLVHISLYDLITYDLFYVLVLLFLGISVLFVCKNNVSKTFVDYSSYPYELSEYILDNYDMSNFRVFNEYGYGSYLLFRGIPVFIDSRCDLYNEEFNSGVTILKDEIKIVDNYNEVFKKYNLDYVIVRNTSMLNKLLKIDSNYDVIYDDSLFSLYKNLTL